MNGSGCKTCPVKNCDTLTYRGSRCAALRDAAGFGDPITNADRLQSMNGEDRRNALIAYFSQWAGIGDSYIYDLTRVKSAFAVGTMGLDDFEEWDEARIVELVDEFLEWLRQPSTGEHHSSGATKLMEE